MTRSFNLAPLISVFLMALASQPYAADKKSPAPLSGSFVSELRLGLSYQDPGGPEEGSASIAGEVLFTKPITPFGNSWDLLVPRLHVGASGNLAGDTSFAYAGFTWTLPITDAIFVEGALGGGIHNGETGRNVPMDRLALGCSPLFREAAAIGYKLTPQWSVMASVEHLSNAGLCNANRGLTNVGLKLGYNF
jgi:lipid A 3-O-deacylase